MPVDRPAAPKASDPKRQLRAMLALLDRPLSPDQSGRRLSILTAFLGEHGLEVRGSMVVDKSGDLLQLKPVAEVVRRVVEQALQIAEKPRA